MMQMMMTHQNSDSNLFVDLVYTHTHTHTRTHNENVPNFEYIIVSRLV